jgi:hypothetical protein
VSSTTWTPPAVASEAFRARRRLWRAVEAQHVASTLRLVSGIEEQLVLERILEANKPPIPIEAAGLHYLLATPFRYPAPQGSRFRSTLDPGVWYGAEDQRTACAELGYWRWRFLTDSPELGSLGPAPQTVFRAGIDAKIIDLTRAPFKRDRAQWTHPVNYGPTQQFAEVARQANLGAIRYESVRDPQHGAAIAVLRPQSFAPQEPLTQETWFLTIKPDRVAWQREGATFEFEAAGWVERTAGAR